MLTVDEILREFESEEDQPSVAALRAAVERREEVVPQLLILLEYTSEHPGEVVARPAYRAHLIAMIFLASFREKEAFPAVMRFFEMEDSLLHDVLGEDFLHGSIPRVVASVFNGDFERVLEVVKRRHGDCTRLAAFDTVTALVQNGCIDRTVAVEAYQQLFKTGDFSNNEWTDLAFAVSDANLWELRPAVEQLLSEKLIDEDRCPKEQLEMGFAGSPSAVFGLISDPVDEMGSLYEERDWWGTEGEDSETDDEETQEEGGSPLGSAGSTQVKPKEAPVSPVPSRNAPCPCGSGKKYKRCCGAKPRH